MTKTRKPLDISQRLLPFQQAIVVPTNKAYCVYTHSYQGTVFYVGKGIPSRPFDGLSRNKRWETFVQNITSYEVSIIFWTDDEDLAYSEESRLIQLLKPLCNRPQRIYMSEKVLGFIAFALRLPPDLHTMLTTLADHEHRSLNAQIITLLLEAVAARTQRRKPSDASP